MGSLGFRSLGILEGIYKVFVGVWGPLKGSIKV